jgi:nucleotide-binding universal stress UspA family protein
MHKLIFMKTIVAPTDFSPISLNAVNYATDMARAIGAKVSLLHVCVIPISYSDVPLPPDSIDDMEREAEEALQRLKVSLEQRTGGNVIIDIAVKSGNVVTQITEYCESVTPLLVIIGTQGSSAIARLFFGSNAIGVMKHIARPLLVVPPQSKFTGIKNVGLACDMKKVMETSPVEEIKNILKLFGAKLFVLYINKNPEPVYSAEVIEESGRLQEMIQDLKPTYRFIENTNTEEGLREFTESNRLDILIVVPKKHNLLEQLFHKSHSKQLMLTTDIPLMSVHD